MELKDILLIVINFAGSLAVFLFAMKLMSEGLQNIAGSRMRAILGKITDHPVSGILTGTAVTAVIQSSSATTVMVVSFVNAGLLTLSGAVAVIMGANIGTTATAWLITLLGLNESSGMFSLPMLLATISLFFLFTKRDKSKHLAQTMIGLALLLVGMDLLKEAMPDLTQNPALLQGIASLSGYGFGSTLLFILIGTLLTCLVQSSSAMMAITLVMCHNGWIDLTMAVALVMGQNIGTTITANLAATVASINGKRAARAHLLFNVVGVLLTLVVYRPIITFINGLFPTDVPMAITVFHTIFNVGNTLVLVWFIPQILWLVEHMVPEKATKQHEEEAHLTYIGRGTVGTPELNLEAAKRELQLFSKQVLRMYALLPDLRTARTQREFDSVMNRITEYEQLTDRMEREVTKFLTDVAAGGLSAHGSERVNAMLRVADNLESVGDSILQIALTRKNKRADAVHFSDHQNANLLQMSALVENALMVMDSNLVDYNQADLKAANDAEHQVNQLRDRLREEHLQAIHDKRYNYDVGIAYSNLVALYEKLADYVINISEAVCNTDKYSINP